MISANDEPIPTERNADANEGSGPAGAPLLGKRFAKAFAYALELHGGQVRKGTRIPYISHLMAVASIVLEHGGGEDEAIGTLLHDAAEDAGGKATLHEICRRFGEAVANIVDGCTDTYECPKPPWKPRKEAYIARIATESPAARLVSAADKLHNARSILLDFRKEGDQLWDRFNGGKEGTLWYYRALVEAYRSVEVVKVTPLIEELERVVVELERAASGKPQRSRS